MRYQFYRSLFILCLFCEILLLTSQRMRYLGQRENGVVMLLISVAMGIFALLAALEQVKPIEKARTIIWENRLLKMVAACGIGLAIFHFNREIRVIPILPQLSDILPTIQVMNQRLLGGQYPYALIQEFGYDLSPTYLPLMYMPFLPAAVFHFDERWMAFLIWSIATIAMIWRAHTLPLSTPAKWLITALPFFHFILIEEATDATFGHTIEIMIAGFYMLLALQLDKIQDYLSGSPLKKGALLAFFIVLCLLSRYSFLLWLPLFFAVVWFENRKLALYTSGWVLVGVLCLFILPFLFQDPMIYFNGLKHYSVAALGVWNEPGRFGVLYHGIGVAGIFRDNCGHDMSNCLALLQRWQAIVSASAVGICGLIYWKKRAEMQHLSLFLLGSLKLYFAFFYGFIQMPYTYLMLTPFFFSIVMLLAFYRKTPLNAPAGL